MKIYPNPQLMIQDQGHRFLGPEAKKLVSNKWQGLSNGKGFNMIEIFDSVIRTQIPSSMEALQEFCQPDLPWAENHFQERISGEPTNPGNTYKDWPYYREDDYRKGGKFTHTYQERFWPKEANRDRLHLWEQNRGIRFGLGDLNDVIIHLSINPDSRQAYLPIWFPEDTGVLHGGRVPCTLGYLFNIRDGFLHCSYFLRSCDYIRHFKNDVYMAGRLMQHILDKLKERTEIVKGMDFNKVKIGYLKMVIDSFHIFETDLFELKKRIK